MNTHILSLRAHFGAFFALMACLFVAPQLQAAPPAAIHSANAPATVYITVPASGAPATFYGWEQEDNGCCRQHSCPS